MHGLMMDFQLTLPAMLRRCQQRFGDKPIVAGPQLRVLDAPETPRAWFLNLAGDQLIQLQRDRIGEVGECECECEIGVHRENGSEW